MKNASFALFAATVESGATFENITVAGTLTLANDYATDLIHNLANYNIGIATADGNYNGITLGAVSCVFADPAAITNGTTIVITADGDVKVTPA